MPKVRHPRPDRSQVLTDVQTRAVGPKEPGFDATTSIELPGQRTATSREYRNADGSTTRRLFSGPANVRRQDGGWTPMDLRLTTGDAERLRPRRGPHQVDFGPTADSHDLATLALDDGHQLAFALRRAASVRGRVVGSSVRYPGVRPHTDLRLSATTTGVKEELVLRSADAPTVFEFKLRSGGLTPTLNRATGDIGLEAGDGTVRAVIPAGWMADSHGAVSHDVDYRLSGADGSWTLRVGLDAAWLREQSRAFPVTVDPSVRIESDDDDTYVTKGAPGNHSGEIQLKVGNQGSGRISASYLHFSGLAARLRNQYVRGASLVLYNAGSASCTPRPVDVFAVGRSWSGSSMTAWPGAPLGRHLAQRSFAHGHEGCTAGDHEPFPLPAGLVTDWTHGRAFHGLSVRAANEGDTAAFKRFGSANAADPDARPYLDVTYSPHGARYRVQEVTLPTGGHFGRLKATVTNRGSSTWTPTGPHRFGYIVKQDGSVVLRSKKISVPHDVAPNRSVLMDIQMEKLVPGDYQVFLTMYNGSLDYQPTYGVPYGVFDMTVVNVEPSVNREQPGNGAAVGSIVPTLYAEGIDTDHWPNTGLKYQFKLCAGSPSDPVGCATSGWESATWTPPAGTLRWSETYFWWVRAHDNVEAGPWAGPIALTTQVPQPEITAHLGGTPQGAPAPGLDPQVGNFGMASTDADIATVGPDLTITRTYNSLDPRTDTAFGQGWASQLDTQLVEDRDGTGNVVVTLPSGRQVRFGRNHDGSFTPPQGQNLTLVYDSTLGYYTLRDASGSRWTFNPHGRLLTVTDPAGLVVELEYDQAGPTGKPKSVYNRTSRRRLHLTWTDGHVTSVHSDPLATGGPGLEWTYHYLGDQLTSACDPGSAPNCTHYDYTPGSHYRSVVLDDNPRAYWRLGESNADTGAASATARGSGADTGTYTGVSLGGPGALAGTADTSAGFGGNDAQSRVVLPQKLHSPTMSLAVELWFRTSSGGVLVSYADKPFGTAPTLWTPALYVGQDGLLRGGFWVPDPDGPRQISSEQPVDDGQWHHVVLSGSIDRQTLYVDGVAQRVDGSAEPATVRGPIDHDEMPHLVVGAGNTKGWPSGTNGDFHFGGHIDEVALYQHALGSTAVAQHHAAAQQVQQLTKVTLPQDGRVAAALTYDDVNDRVATLTDHDGRTWQLDTPTRDGAVREVTLHGPYPDWHYEFDADHGGRLTARTHDGRTRRYEYNTEGFLAKETDENGHEVLFTTDERGNVLSRTTCRAPDSCQASYATYFHNEDDLLDPRNDRTLTESDARSSGPDDVTYRTSYEYDRAGRLVSATYPRPRGASQTPTETWVYSTGAEPAEGGGNTPAGLLTRHTGKRPGQETLYLYRANGDLAEQIDPSGLRTRFDYDAIGRKTTEATLSASGEAFGTTTYTYTPRSLVDTETGPVTRNPITGVDHRLVTDYDHDANGNTTQVTLTDSAGADPPRTTTYEYDEHDHLVATTYPDGSRETREYLDAGQEVRVTDPDGTTWISYLDSQSRLVRRVASGPGVDPEDPKATVLTLEVRSYDAAGRLAVQSDAMGRETTYTYYDDDRLATVTRAGVVQERRTYDAAGNLTKLTEAGGRVTTWAYDPAGEVASTTLDPGGLDRTVTYARDPDGLVATERRTGAADPDRIETVSYGYDDAGGLIREDVELAPGTTLSTTYTRDERGLVTSETDRRRLTTDYRYDDAGRLVAEIAPPVTTWVDGQQTTGVRPRVAYGYNAFDDSTHQRDANGAVTELGYDELGRNTTVRLPTYTPPAGEPVNAVVTTTYDDLGNPVETTDPLGHVTQRTFDPYGRVTSETLPPVGDTPTTTTYQYDRNGELLAVTDPSGAQRLSRYDDFGRKITDAAVERGPEPTYFITRYDYDDAGNQIEVTTPSGAVTKTAYNSAGEPVSVTDPTGRVTRYDYDIAGRATRVTEPSGLVTATTYDPLGRATAVSQLAGEPLTERRRWQHRYDPNGNLVRVTSPEQRVQSFGYDAADRLVWQEEVVSDATTIRTTFGYDAAGNRSRFVDGNQHATDYTYTSWGLPESTIEPGGHTWTASYDAAGRVVRNTAPGGVAITSDYDAQDRLIGQTGTGAEEPTADKTFGYDKAGRLASFSTPGGPTTVSYDDRGNITSIDGPAGTATLDYDADSRLASRTDATGTSAFDYDDAGRPLSITDGLSGRTIDYTYDSAGRVSSTAERDMGPYLKRVKTYDPLSRLTSDKVTELDPEGGEPRIILGAEYGYDLDDNITSKTTIAENRRRDNAYSYDGAGRLASWTAPDGSITPYAWDDAGNRTRAGSKTFTYNARNQLLSDGTKDYTYTARGTLDSVGGRDLSFDAFDRLITDGGSTYAYDSLDRVAERNGSTFAYGSLGNDVVSDGTRLISRDPDGAPLADKAVDSTTTAKLLYADQHGDVIGRYRGLDSFGQRSYDPFGAVTSSVGEQPSLGYQGEWTEPATGAVNMHSRWYTPDTGGFASRDTWTIPPHPSVAGNRYTYANGNPLAHTDPTGHIPAIIIIWAIRILIALIGAIETSWALYQGLGTIIGGFQQWGELVNPPIAGEPLPSSEWVAEQQRKAARALAEAVAAAIARAKARAALQNSQGQAFGWFHTPGMLAGSFIGPSWMIAPAPPPPPPPLWQINLNNPPPRPAPGSTVRERPYSVNVGHGMVVIDRSDEYAWAATKITPAESGATAISGALATAPLPAAGTPDDVGGISADLPGLPGLRPSSDEQVERPALYRIPTQPWHDDAFPDPLQAIPIADHALIPDPPSLRPDELMPTTESRMP